MTTTTVDKRQAAQERQIWAPFVDPRNGQVSTLESASEKMAGRAKPEMWKYALLAAKVGFVAIYGWPVAVGMVATLGVQAAVHSQSSQKRVKHHLEDTTRQLGTAFEPDKKQDYASALQLLTRNDIAPDKARDLLDTYNAQTQQAGMGGAAAPRLVIVSPEKDPKTYQQYKQMMNAQGVIAMTMQDTGEQVLVASVNHIRATPTDTLNREMAASLATHKLGLADTRPTLADKLNKTANKFMVAGAVWHYGVNVAFDWARPIYSASSAWGPMALIAQPMAMVNAGIMYGAMKLANHTQNNLNNGKVNYHNKILNRAALIIKNSAEIASRNLPKPATGPAVQGMQAGVKAASPQGQTVDQNLNRNFSSNFFNSADAQDRQSSSLKSTAAASFTPQQQEAQAPVQKSPQGLRGAAWRKQI